MLRSIEKIVLDIDRAWGIDLHRRGVRLVEFWRRSALLNALRRAVSPRLVQLQHALGLTDYAKHPLRLHLGCGRNHFENYVNIDLRETGATDLVCSITRLPYPANSVETIETYHVVEHLFRHSLAPALRDWYRVLIPSGTLVIEFPDLDLMMQKYLDGDRKQIDGIYGLQRFEGDCHHFGYTYETLRQILAECGYVGIERAEPQDYHVKEWDCVRVECQKPPVTDKRLRRMRNANDAFTGERVVEGTTPNRIWVDHLERYQFAGKYVRGKAVLDIACGTGYGSNILRQCGASHVLGADISSEAIDSARNRYADSAVQFQVGDLLRIDLPAESFDAITCFETIEHVPDFRTALGNLYKLLRKGGTLLISSPNRPVTSPNAPALIDRPANRYHTQEFTIAELRDELTKAGFRVGPEAAFGQRQAIRFANRTVQSVWRRLWKQGSMSSPEVRPVGHLCPRYFLLVATK